jgi:hypothetical protein
VGDKVADCLRPADCAQVAGAIERMEAGVAKTGRRIPNVV